MAATASTNCDQIVFDSDNAIALDNVEDESVTPAVPILGATVSATFRDEADDSVIFGPIALLEFPGAPSNDYRATFFASTANGFSVGQRVQITIDFDGGVGLRRMFRFVSLVCE